MNNPVFSTVVPLSPRGFNWWRLETLMLQVAQVTAFLFSRSHSLKPYLMRKLMKNLKVKVQESITSSQATFSP